MTRKDIFIVGALAVAILALLAPVWARGYPPAFFNHGDLYAYHWPLRHHTAAALAEGRFPFWNPYALLGVPHAANPQAALFYPPALLGALLPVITALAWEQILHLLWAALGAFLLARASRASRAAAVVLAAAYALSPFLVYRVTAGIPTLLAALSWTPWAWLAWLGGSASLLAAVFAFQFFSGHPQFLLINAVGMALWAAPRPQRATLWTRLAAGACGALALAAVQWLPTLEFLRGSNRSVWPMEFAAAYSLDPAALKMWLWPGALGTPSLSPDVQLGGGWRGPVSVFYESGGVWLGVTALALAAWGLVSNLGKMVSGLHLSDKCKPGTIGCVLLAASGFLLALGVNGPLGPLLVLPGFSYLRTPSRWSFLVLWGLWLLAGSGLRQLAAVPRRAAWLALLPLVVLAELAAWDAGFLQAQDPGPFTAPNVAVAARLAGRPVRVLTDPALANPNKAIVYRMRNVNGYDAFFPAGAVRWAAEAEGAPAADSSRIMVSRWRSSAAVRAGVAARLTAEAIEETSDAWPLAAFVDRDGRRLMPDPILSIDRPERWRVSGVVPKGAAGVSLAEARWPGWRVFLSGREIEPLAFGSAFQVVPLTPSAAAIDLRFEFTPSGWTWWAALSAAAWVWWLRAVARYSETE